MGEVSRMKAEKDPVRKEEYDETERGIGDHTGLQ